MNTEKRSSVEVDRLAGDGSFSLCVSTSLVDADTGEVLLRNPPWRTYSTGEGLASDIARANIVLAQGDYPPIADADFLRLAALMAAAATPSAEISALAGAAGANAAASAINLAGQLAEARAEITELRAQLAETAEA